MEKKFVKGEKEYLVRVSLCDGSYYHGFVFSVDLHTRPKGKRKWVQFIDVNGSLPNSTIAPLSLITLLYCSHKGSNGIMLSHLHALTP